MRPRGEAALLAGEKSSFQFQFPPVGVAGNPVGEQDTLVKAKLKLLARELG
jgi:hypothetical protein